MIATFLLPREHSLLLLALFEIQLISLSYRHTEMSSNNTEQLQVSSNADNQDLQLITEPLAIGYDFEDPWGVCALIDCLVELRALFLRLWSDWGFQSSPG